MRSWLSISLRAPRSTIAAIALVTAVLAVFAARIRIDSAIENLLPDGDPGRAYYETVRTVFGSEETTIVGVFGDVFTPATLATIDRLSTRLATLDGVREVISLTTVKGAESDAVGVRIGRLMRELPRTDAEARALQAKIMQRPALHRRPGLARRQRHRHPRPVRAVVGRRVHRPRSRRPGAAGRGGGGRRGALRDHRRADAQGQRGAADGAGPRHLRAAVAAAGGRRPGDRVSHPARRAAAARQRRCRHRVDHRRDGAVRQRRSTWAR